MLVSGRDLRCSQRPGLIVATYSWLMAGEAERIHGETQKANDNPSLRFFTQKVPIGPVALLCP